METWAEGRLGDFADVKGGKRLPKGKRLSEFSTAHPYIRIRDIGKAKNLQLTSDYEYVDDETQKVISRYVVTEGDILISVVGTIGLIGVVGHTLDGANQTENCDRITNLNGIDRDFLYYYLISPSGQEEILKGTVGAVQPKLPLKNIQNFKIRYPSLQKQRKIASILSSLDDKIANNEQINNHLEQMACTIFSDIMAHTSAPLCSLKQLANINPSRKLPKGSCARYIDMSRLSTTGCFPSGWEYKAYNGGIRFTNGDTLLARITPCLENGKTAYVNFLEDQEIAFGSTEYVVISPKDPYPPELFYCLARYPAFVDYAVKNMNGSSGRQRVSAETIGNYIMPALTPDDLMDFCETVPSMFQAIRKGAVENISLIRLRDTLLPRLMSGELGVSGLNL